jgi:type VI secretion system protein ImpC
VDCDNFQQVMDRLDVRLNLPGQGELRFRSLDDFHPDQLMKQVRALAGHLESRAQLRNPATAAAAAAELRSRISGAANAPASQSGAPPAESDGQTLSRLLGGAPPAPAPPGPPRQATAIEKLLREAAASSLAPSTSAEHSALLAWTELELTEQLRSILHHPDFQRLEAAWRAVDLLVRNFGGEEQIKILLLDVTAEELAADLTAREDLASTELARLLRREAEELPWAVWVGLYTLGNDVGEIEMLGRLARLAAATGAPFLAGASSGLVGCDSLACRPDPEDWQQPVAAELEAAWSALRALPEAQYLGLALPRFLLRQPYGKGSDPIESFPFEELPADPPHEGYLWGNPAILCADLLAEAFRADGWDMRPTGYGEVSDLPVHRFSTRGEIQVKPCAEAWLTERAGELILARGLVPVLSVKGKDAARVANLRSVRSPAAALAGRWGE